jgi:hypothetical protein
MMLGMHPWTGLSDEVRLGVLTEWVTADLVDEVLAECGKAGTWPSSADSRNPGGAGLIDLTSAPWPRTG